MCSKKRQATRTEDKNISYIINTSLFHIRKSHYKPLLFYFSGSNANFPGCDVILIYFEKIHMDSAIR